MDKLAGFLDGLLADEASKAGLEADIGIRKEREISDEELEGVIGGSGLVSNPIPRNGSANVPCAVKCLATKPIAMIGKYLSGSIFWSTMRMTVIHPDSFIRKLKKRFIRKYRCRVRL